ncbi:MAG: ubiquinol oxidase subunit II [Buchnera aphidicola (Meitanaphis microgallis)]
MQFLKCPIYILKFFLIIFVMCLCGCDSGILFPKGNIALEQRSLILTSFLVMLLIIIPVFFMTFFFAIRYRETNINANYRPNWSQSNIVEMFIWGLPIIIIIFLSTLSWKSAHDLDPHRKIISNVEPIKINVISLDWKWLFIYPGEKIATINELVFPVNTPIVFELTSSSVMNSFFIPSLGSQIYTMAGMKTHLNLIANTSGIYSGISANYSGVGFSDMKFRTVVTPNFLLFKEWINKVKRSPYQLSSMSSFKRIAHPSQRNAIEYYSNVKDHLFSIVIKKSRDVKE